MRQHPVFAALLAALVMLTLLIPSGAQAATSLEATPASVAAGERVDVVGRGFVRNERVSAWVTTSDQRVIDIGFAKALGDEGRVELSYRVPGDAIGGRWALTVYGEVSQTPTVAFFEVIGRTPTSGKPPIAVNPPEGAPGTRFSFFASGYDDFERISYWFTGPDGTIIAYPEETESTSEGDVYFDWVAPADIQRGTWVVTVQGKLSNHARGIRFEIR
jgi:hypothetical protein